MGHVTRLPRSAASAGAKDPASPARRAPIYSAGRRRDTSREVAHRTNHRHLPYLAKGAETNCTGRALGLASARSHNAPRRPPALAAAAPATRNSWLIQL